MTNTKFTAAQANVLKIHTQGAALQKYQRGDSLTDQEMRDARDFAELLSELSSAHPDCRVFRLYTSTALQLDEFVRIRTGHNTTRTVID